MVKTSRNKAKDVETKPVKENFLKLPTQLRPTIIKALQSSVPCSFTVEQINKICSALANLK